MTKKVVTVFSLAILSVSAVSVQMLESRTSLFHTIVTPNTVALPVPYITQLPYGLTTRPWSEACEEASALMVDSYYRGRTVVTTDAAIGAMQPLFHFENQMFGGNDNTNAEQTAEFITAKLSFDTLIESHPTIEDIKKQLILERPVIALVNRFALYQDNTRKLPKTSYHMVVITGFDDHTQTFTVADPARSGVHTYDYTHLVAALHDYTKATGEADGDPVVLFTAPRPAH